MIIEFDGKAGVWVDEEGLRVLLIAEAQKAKQLMKGIEEEDLPEEQRALFREIKDFFKLQ